jgi:hypothetical protein
MKMVKPGEHTKTERLVMAMAINRYGSGQHPIADEESLQHFACEYTLGCLEAAIKQDMLNDDGKAVARNAIATLRLTMMPVVTAVVAKRYGGGWQYLAITDEGEEVVIRHQATRLYLNAYMYREEAASGNKKGLSRHFTFGKHISRYHAASHMATYPIKMRCHRCGGEVTDVNGYRGCETCGEEV